MTHYQDNPAFIGPRLPPEHPAYRAHVDGAAKVELVPIPALIVRVQVSIDIARAKGIPEHVIAADMAKALGI